MLSNKQTEWQFPHLVTRNMIKKGNVDQMVASNSQTEQQLCNIIMKPKNDIPQTSFGCDYYQNMFSNE